MVSAPICASGTELRPSRYVTAVVNTASQDAFLRQIQTFAKAHAFEVDTMQVPDPDRGLHTRVNLSTADLEIIAANPFSACAFGIAFYEINPVPPHQIQAPLSQMIESLRQVDGVTVSEGDPSISATPAKPCH